MLSADQAAEKEVTDNVTVICFLVSLTSVSLSNSAPVE